MTATTIDGLLVLDKPGGLTSRAALDRALRWFPRGTRMGHTGTLDPLATGVLVLCLGAATRLAEYVQRMGKTYRAGLLLGARSDTDDADGTVTPTAGADAPGAAALRECLAGFVGTVEQVPPAFSAAKVTGRRAYDLARQGHEVALTARSVRIYGIDVLRYAWPHLELEVRCGKGTYVRSLARDLGDRLGCGGLVAMLRRTRVGPFTAEEAVSLEATPDAARARLLPAARAVAELPRVTLPEREVRRLRQGQAAALPADFGAAGEEVAVFDEAGALAAVAAVAAPDRARRTLRPVKVL
jgi:tRNA pseudouridine55 synthase